MSDPEVFPERLRVALPCRAILGEAPVWDERTGRLLFVDIKSSTLFAWRPGDAEPERHDLGEDVTFVKLTPDPAVVVVGGRNAIARYHLGERRRDVVLSVEPDRPGNRLNDAAVGPDGSLYVGTMHDAETDPTGTFYHWSDRGLVRFGYDAVVTNGPTFDYGRRLVFTADTQANRIFVHAVAADGTPDDGRLFVTLDEASGHPDGLTLDADGHLWVCHFGGGRITRYSPEGRPVLVVPVPTAQVTKMTFGGPDLSTAYVTTAARGRDPHLDPMAGHLFTFEAGIRGLPADLCRLVG